MSKELLTNVPTHPKTPAEIEQVEYQDFWLGKLQVLADARKSFNEFQERMRKPITLFEAKDRHG